MDLGSIEDLLRPASLRERKQKLGLLAADGAPSRNLAPVTPADSSKMHNLGHNGLAVCIQKWCYECIQLPLLVWEHARLSRLVVMSMCCEVGSIVLC